jgi:ferredoxin-NADP reductase
MSVKREGLVSSYVHTKLHVGACLQAAQPRGEFVLIPGTEPVLLISAGVGITPMMAMLHELAAEHSEREVWWLHSARNAEQQAFAQEAHRLLVGLASAHEHVFHTAPDAEADPSSLPVTHGHLTPETLAGLHLPPTASAYICGPERFMTDMTKALTDIGLELGAVHTELFGALAPINPGLTSTTQTPPHPPEGKPGTGPLVTFARSGLTTPWNTATAPSLLEFAEACDVPTRWSCRTGVCHTCVSPLLTGEVAYRPEPLDLPACGRVLVCCARPTSDIVLDM